MLRPFIAGAAFAALSAASAQAQTVVDGSNVDEVIRIAQTFGPASAGELSTDGNPTIAGEIDGVGYQIFFMNCTDGANCEDVNFYAGFSLKPALDVINGWNRDKRFGKAYLDSELDAVVEFDVNLEHGVTQENLNAAFEIWTLILDQYTTYIGFK